MDRICLYCKSFDNGSGANFWYKNEMCKDGMILIEESTIVSGVQFLEICGCHGIIGILI